MIPRETQPFSRRHLPDEPLDLRPRILEVLADPSSGVQDLALLISVDPEIERRVLQLANSACYGQCGRVTGAARAVLLLGFTRIGQLLRGF